MPTCSKCGTEQLILFTLGGKPYCSDCLRQVIRDKDFIKKLLKKRHPDKDWNKIKINLI